MSSNMKTIQEAIMTRCPHFFELAYSTTYEGTMSSQQPTAMTNADSYCLGSGCMMWKWASGSSEKGYCGLAGKVVIP